MAKYDVKTAHRALYAPSAQEFVEVEVPGFRYVAVDGEGDPNTAESYARAVEAVYGVSYTLKFAGKADGRDHVVGPLEALWRADDPSVFLSRDKGAWEWTVMIWQPDWVDGTAVEHAVADVSRKKPNPALAGLRLFAPREGRCVQILHVGPYDDEGPTLARLHDEYLPAHGLAFNGDHHEIYLSDPRRVAPAKLRTVLRQPVRAV
ncbi:GyrI-like domain-containing protein [Myceligenerans pegani]|uniref:GyrI-like domain-containing protein n=1 Tax=Myceligenerans pegani TaxID=2776917 RepID=A0ABR9N4T2_9MICO|nr:GyrI-like domain-containing protein [Myceligenerans sp. TRM 65318]MBE1878688.1 GyrI-like domain-containing protein [Myceligenerans sp. TRM 65318]MBE3020959.1 GyrI-like domain-containing protein [Myceligenerans sp. TRM 65318]